MLIPSASGESPYFLHQEEGRWVCDCRAGCEGQPCKHALLLELIDAAWQLLTEQDAATGDDADDSGDPGLPPAG